MGSGSKAQLRIIPYVLGVRSRDHAVIRAASEPRYLCLTRNELAVFEGLATQSTTVEGFLGRHLGGHGGLGFKEALSLLTRLHASGFLVGASADMLRRLKDFAGRNYGQTASQLRRAGRFLAAAIDLPLLLFRSSEVHPLLRRFGAIIVSAPALILYGLLLTTLAIRSGISVLPDGEAYFQRIDRPEILLAETFFALSVAASWLAILQMAALAGAGVRFVGGSVRITGLFVLRLGVHDDDVFMLSKGALLRYHLFTLASPWVFGLLAWQTVDGTSVLSLGGLFAGAFALLGILALCPLYRSPLVKVAEGYLARLGILGAANSYLGKGLFRLRDDEGQGAEQLWMVALASMSMIWLYGVFLLFFDAAVSAVPDLFVLTVTAQPLRAVAAGILIFLLALAMVLPLVRLVAIPLQNLWTMAALPLRKARVGISNFHSKNMTPSEAVTAFLKEIPILGHLNDETLTQLTGALLYKPFRQGQTIIRQGDMGDAFFILAEGQAQVIVSGPQGEEVVDVLHPGDSFGEIALIERVTRTATIRALTPVKTLALGRGAFDALFPEGSDDRAGLTAMIRHVKLLLDSQALSHLTPRQIRELLRHSSFVEFGPGTPLIAEGEVGDSAYLIESGMVRVVKDGETVAEMGRGALVGQVALIRDVKRTASVSGIEAGRALRIGKETFLKMCMSNVFVAMLVADLSDQHSGPGQGERAEASP